MKAISLKIYSDPKQETKFIAQVIQRYNKEHTFFLTVQNCQRLDIPLFIPFEKITDKCVHALNTAQERSSYLKILIEHIEALGCPVDHSLAVCFAKEVLSYLQEKELTNQDKRSSLRQFKIGNKNLEKVQKIHIIFDRIAILNHIKSKYPKYGFNDRPLYFKTIPPQELLNAYYNSPFKKNILTILCILNKANIPKELRNFIILQSIPQPFIIKFIFEKMPMECQAEALKNLGIDLDAEYDAITSIPYKTDLFPLKRFGLYYLKYNILPSVTVSQRIVEFME